MSERETANGESAGGSKALGLSDIAGRMSDASDGNDVSVEDMIATIGQRAFGRLILVFGLIALSPVGAIPGASLVLGALIILVAGQVLFGRNAPWFPSRLTRISVESQKVQASVDKLDPYLSRIDTFLRPRWRFMMAPPAPRIVALFCIVLAALMYPLAVVPWAVMAPALAIAGGDG